MPTREPFDAPQDALKSAGYSEDEADEVMEMLANGILSSENFADLLDDGEINQSVPGSEPVPPEVQKKLPAPPE